MKKLALFAALLAITSCALFGSKRHEEFEYYGFNETNKTTVRKSEVILTKVSKVESLNNAIDEVKNKSGVKKVASWDFSSKPSKTLQDEIIAKAIEYGANQIILFERKDCDTIDLKKDDVDTLKGTNCYRIYYYNTTVATPTPAASAPANTTPDKTAPATPEKAVAPTTETTSKTSEAPKDQ